ncbi:MAG TPA: hypothetical protein VH598_06405 [Verrucomicrobiae bacterium]|nr:hypothetical protein [Verrucomicrobiae bacterium]
MSLINDALKRAKEKQDQQPLPPEPPTRSMELARHPTGPGLALPLILAVVLALAGIFLWRWFEKRAPQPTEEKTASNSAIQKPAPPAVVASPVPIAPPPVAASNAPNAATNIVESPVPKPLPPAFKLQSIFYNPKNPSVVINGKTLFLGDHVGEAWVISIRQDSATIVTSAGKTNLLELP